MHIIDDCFVIKIKIIMLSECSLFRFAFHLNVCLAFRQQVTNRDFVHYCL